MHEIIFEADTPAGKSFDVWLLVLILLSLVIVTLESVESIDLVWGKWLNVAEWTITILFTIEYILRIISVKKPWGYIFSFYGIIDLISVLPSYISLLIPGSHYFMVLRSLRFVRLFKVLKLHQFAGEGNVLLDALKASRHKITVFLVVVICLAMIMGTVMYIVEGKEHGFSNIPVSIYWAIVTLTTVGYGDISPATPLGQFIASLIMIMGYGIIAVPTGIVSSELAKQTITSTNTQTCQSCGREGHADDALFCKYCGHIL
ncbi:MAG: ion transporter [Chitinophagales bacterium]